VASASTTTGTIDKPDRAAHPHGAYQRPTQRFDIRDLELSWVTGSKFVESSIVDPKSGGAVV